MNPMTTVGEDAFLQGGATSPLAIMLVIVVLIAFYWFWSRDFGIAIFGYLFYAAIAFGWVFVAMSAFNVPFGIALALGLVAASAALVLLHRWFTR